MINMGYCRFENTYLALRECINALYDEDFDDLSDSEKYYAKKLKDGCQEFIEVLEDKLTERIINERA